MTWLVVCLLPALPFLPYLLDKRAQPALAEQGDWRTEYQLD